jgi:DNA-binding transcriptional ArsR family regulator
VHAFDVLGDPVRRRILELLADGEMASGAICAAVQQEFGISQPAVSQHLKVLRDGGLATVCCPPLKMPMKATLRMPVKGC